MGEWPQGTGGTSRLLESSGKAWLDRQKSSKKVNGSRFVLEFEPQDQVVGQMCGQREGGLQGDSQVSSHKMTMMIENTNQLRRTNCFHDYVLRKYLSG